MRDYIEKKRIGKPRRHVMEACEASILSMRRWPSKPC
jgi:hypothetical protein